MKKRILFLYTELAEYFMACVDELASTGAEVHVVRWPVNKEAPFHFRQIEGVTIYDRPEFDKDSLLQLATSINPQVVICSGWVDDGYLSVCREMFEKCPTVLTMDNRWEGTLKQRLLLKAAKWKFKSIFSHAWIPGEPQMEFARKLGFDDKNISTGFYCADTSMFEAAYFKSLEGEEPKHQFYPHRLLFVGRYLEFKGIWELWKAFAEWQESSNTDWELWCVGTGDEWDERIEHDRVKHFGFLQPTELCDLLPQSGAFILPSHKEPWGVAVHEMAAAGLPLLCSDKVGAATAFLEEGQNGFSFAANDKSSLQLALEKLGSLNDAQLIAMGEHSRHLSKKITPAIWAKTVLVFI